MAVLGSACSGGAARGTQPQGPSGIPVKVETAQLVSVNDTTEYVATLKSRDTAVIMPQVEGVITQIFVHSGSRVAAGTPLIQIDPAKQQATLKTQEDTVAAKQAELVWDQQEYDRNNGLYEAKVISKQALDQSKTALDQAKAQLQALQAQVRQESVQLHYYRVTAPSAESSETSRSASATGSRPRQPSPQSISPEVSKLTSTCLSSVPDSSSPTFRYRSLTSPVR